MVGCRAKMVPLPVTSGAMNCMMLSTKVVDVLNAMTSVSLSCWNWHLLIMPSSVPRAPRG